MNKMSEDEYIKIIEKTLHNTKEDLDNSESPSLSEQYIQDVGKLLDLYQQEKEKNKELTDNYDKLTQHFIKNHISKDKIKEFIEENTRTGRGYNEYEEGLIDENDRIIDKLSKMIEED